MSQLLQTLLAFVGVMFVLALAAQSVQELIKAAFTIKGQTLLKAVEGLVRESVRSQGQWTIDADAIMQELTRRLGALGQKGVRKGALRLDTLPAPKLRELLAGIDPGLVPGLPVERPVAQAVLAGIASQAERWYDLAVAPVDERYRRRMRVISLLASAIVVIPLNAGAGRVFTASRSDTTFQHRVAAAVTKLDSIAKADAAKDSAAAAADTTARTDSTVAAAPARPRSPAAEKAALEAVVARGDSALLNFGPPTRDEMGHPGWWLGMALSILFVSLGAPFWHDLLETIFGLKNRLSGPSVPDAKVAEREMQRESAGAAPPGPPGPSPDAARAAERLITDRAAQLPDTI